MSIVKYLSYCCLLAGIVGRPAWCAEDCPRAKELVDQALGETDPALQVSLYQSALEKCSGIGGVRHNLGVAMWHKGDREAGIAEVGKARLTGSDPDMHVTFGSMALALGQSDEAKKAFETALEIDPDNAKALNGIAAIYGKTGNSDKALETLMRADTINATDTQTLTNLGVLYEQQNESLRAVNAYQRAVRSDADALLPRVRLGIIQQELGQYTDSVNNLQRAVTLRPKDPMIRQVLGVSYERLGEFNEAEEQFVEVLKARPNYPESYVNLASVLIKQARFKDATELLSEAEIKLASSAPVLTTHAWVLIRLDKLPEAKAKLEQSLTFDSSLALTYNHLGVVYTLLGEKAKADEAFRAAIKIDPSLSTTQVNLKRDLDS